MWPRQFGRRGHDDDLPRPRRFDLLEHASECAGSIAQPVRFAAPVAFGCEQNERRLRQAGDCQRPRERGQALVARNAREVERFGRSAIAALRGLPEKEGPPFVGAEQREHEVAPGVEVVHHDEQLAEAWLSQVVRQQLGVALGEILRLRLTDLGPAAYELPQACTEVGGRPAITHRRRQRCPPEAAPLPAPRGKELRVDHGGNNDRSPEQEHNQQSNPRQPDGQASRAERGRHERGVTGGHAASGARAQGLEHQRRSEHEKAQRQHRHRNQQHQHRGDEAPPRHSQDRTPAVQPADGVAAPQPVRIPEARAAIERGKHRADRTDAMSGDEIDLHTGFGQRAEHTRVVRPVGAGPRQNDGRAELRRIGSAIRGGLGHGQWRAPGCAGAGPRAGAPAVIRGRGW